MDAREKQFNAALGARIRAIRTSKKPHRITQADLADVVGLTRTSIVNIERGSQGISAFNLAKIATCLGASVEELLPSVRASSPASTDEQQAPSNEVGIPPELKGAERVWAEEIVRSALGERQENGTKVRTRNKEGKGSAR